MCVYSAKIINCKMNAWQYGSSAFDVTRVAQCVVYVDPTTINIGECCVTTVTDGPDGLASVFTSVMYYCHSIQL